MKISLKTILYIIPLLLSPLSFVYAGPNVVWSTELINNGQSITGTLTVSGIDQNGPVLNLFIFSDSDPDFNPHISHALLGVATNGSVPISIPSGGSMSYFLPVIVDAASYSGNFSPYEDQSQFQIYSVGQVAFVGSGSGGNGNGGSGGNGNGTGGGGTGGGGTGNGNGTGAGATATTTNDAVSTLGWPAQVIDNPLQVSDLNNFIVGLLNALIKIGIPIMTIFLVYSGLRLVMARGNEKELVDAKKNLLWVIIGAAILLGSWTIVKVLKGTFDEIDLAYITSLINHIV